MPIAKITASHPDTKVAVYIERDTGKRTALFMDLHGEQVAELRDMLFRSANTLDPLDTPKWITELLDVLDNVPQVKS